MRNELERKFNLKYLMYLLKDMYVKIKLFLRYSNHAYL